jgi:hypothetical protein
MFFRSTCLHCGYSPCSVDASFCPRCGHAWPNPGLNSRINAVISGFFTAGYLLLVGGVFAVPGWMVHPYIGVSIGAFAVFCAVKVLCVGIWYAFDPTMTILPRVRSSH